MQKSKTENFSIFSSLDVKLEFLTSRVELIQFSVESSHVKLKMWATQLDLDLSSKCQLETRLNDQSMSNTELMTLKQYLNDVLMKEWIKHFISSIDAFILFILKKNDSLCLCMNYQDLNKITVKNCHSLSLISETLDRFNQVKQFIKFNLKNAYHHLRIQREDKWKMTFHTHYDHFEYIIMSFNLINASVIFQTYINKILTELLNDFCVIYLNDILIFFIEKTDHVNHVKQILKRLRKFKLYASLKKCTFFITKVNFLEFVVFTKNVSMNLSRIDIIKTWFR